MKKHQTVEMIFYSHPWSTHLLGDKLIDENRRNIIIEVAETSQLEYICGSKKRSTRGVLPLLTQPSKVDIFALADTFPLIAAPIILAAKPSITRQALIHALLVLESRPFGCDTIYLMCHVQEAKYYEALFPIVDRFSLLWDPADYPTHELVECTEALQRTESLNADNWGGIVVSNHWLRKTPDLLHNTAQIEQLVSSAGV